MIEPNFSKGDGLVPAIVQDADTKDVLMMAYMNRESWEATLKSGKATFWSRSRQKLWLKGESSGNVQIFKAVFIDCEKIPFCCRSSKSEMLPVIQDTDRVFTGS